MAKEKEKKEIERIVVTHIAEVVTGDNAKVSADIVKWNIDGKLSADAKLDIRKMKMNKDGEWTISKGIGLTKEEAKILLDDGIKQYCNS